MARELIEKDRTIPSAAASYDLAAQPLAFAHFRSHLPHPVNKLQWVIGSQDTGKSTSPIRAAGKQPSRLKDREAEGGQQGVASGPEFLKQVASRLA